jgi:hypothetical protein
MSGVGHIERHMADVQVMQEGRTTMSTRTNWLRRSGGSKFQLVVSFLLIWALSAARHLQAQQDAGNSGVQMLPKELEIRLALSALPKRLREGASVRVLESTGYVRANAGTNAFTCIVSRRGGSGNLFPLCFDEEGTHSILPVYLDDALLQLKGATNEEINRQIAAGYEKGLYRPAARPGIAYMMSGAMFSKTGALEHVGPHLMFYAPYLKDSDVGGAPGQNVFLSVPGPHGMIIVPVGEKERKEIQQECQGLIDDVKRLTGRTGMK